MRLEIEESIYEFDSPMPKYCKKEIVMAHFQYEVYVESIRITDEHGGGSRSFLPLGVC